ncbi:hypothetical protein AB0A05_27400 [Streptomyces sp. NPDC046374]|uniref:hypothetical protein n=1 Tax=Streptomyces sp. NPDC046374 TaxID=3154917 RepID=UPI0033D8A748
MADDPCAWAQAHMCCCPWPIDASCCPDIPGPGASAGEKDRFGRALAIASERLRRLTAGRYGLCEELIRPCKSPCNPYEQYVPWEGRGLYGNGDGGILDPYAWRGGIANSKCGTCVEDCSCGPVCRTSIPGPVAEVLQVKVDGLVLPPEAYRLTEGPDWWLVRVDGGPCWPDCQAMDLEDDQPGTFSVRYLRGRDPADDPDAIRAVTVLTCELYKSMCGQKCRISGRVRSINREGISYDMAVDWPRRGTGLEEVDDWLSLVNPTGNLSRPAVYTPDLPQHRFWGAGGGGTSY